MPVANRLIAPCANREISSLLSRHAFGQKLMLVFDDITWLAAAQEISAYLSDYEIIPYSLGHEVHATIEHAEAVKETAKSVDGLIAIGAGTINDITKYAAAELNKPYLAVATAASMNGYSSSNASLLSEGIKQSYLARPPRAVLADITVLAAAPKRLARAGLGDTLCRSSVEVDMLLSHFLFGAAYPRELFERQRRHEAALIAGSAKLTANDHDISFYPLLMEALLDAGDAMAEHGSSAVASQGEHMIAHTAEVMYGSELTKVLHGEMIAVTSLTSSHLQQHMLLGTPSVKPLPRMPSLFLRVFGKASAERLDELYKKKLLTADRAKEINALIAKNWPQMKQAMYEVMLPPVTLDRALILAGAPTRPHEIKLEPERYQNAVTYAHMARDRFTFLDLAAMNDKRV